MKLLLTVFLLGAFCCCGQVTSQETLPVAARPLAAAPPSVLSTPDGWMPYPDPSGDSALMSCANASMKEWRVVADGENVSIRPDKVADGQAPLPAVITEKSVRVGTKGRRSVQLVDDGWLVGLDVGEFGGGLWWFSSDGKTSKKLADDNIRGFARTSVGVLALSGLAHLSLNTGKVLRIAEGAEGNRSVTTLVDLGSAPQVFAIESPEAVLVLTTRGLVRVRASGKMEPLRSTKYISLYPTSMTLSPSGVIHVGMRHFITRLTPAGDVYNEEWFVPADCPKFKMREYNCVCSSK